jgi:hypothetical protein
MMVSVEDVTTTNSQLLFVTCILVLIHGKHQTWYCVMVKLISSKCPLNTLTSISFMDSVMVTAEQHLRIMKTFSEPPNPKPASVC